MCKAKAEREAEEARLAKLEAEAEATGPLCLSTRTGEETGIVRCQHN